MFERYTEKARRIIFFARYEASQFGSGHIESEHLLLGLLGEDKPLASRVLNMADSIDSIREQVEATTPMRSKVSTSVDLPLSLECKRILAYASEEAERLNHKHIGSAHLLAGLLREPNSTGARLLAERQVGIEVARKLAAESRPDSLLPVTVRARPAVPPPSLLALLEEREMLGDITVAFDTVVAGHSVEIAVYEGGDESAVTRQKIRHTAQRMENAIANHQFDLARSCSEEERRLREDLSLIRERHPSKADGTPFLCIAIAGDESLQELRGRIESYLNAGVAQVWLLDPSGKRAYTATAAEGLREVTGDILRIAHPKIELDRNRIFGQ